MWYGPVCLPSAPSRDTKRRAHASISSVSTWQKLKRSRKRHTPLTLKMFPRWFRRA